MAGLNIPSYIKVTDKGTHHVLYNSEAAVACSGTVTLECGLFNVPMLIIYTTSAFTYFLGKRLVKIPYIGMVNVIKGDFVAQEFIQKDMHLNLVLPELTRLVFDPGYRRQIKAGLKQVQAGVDRGQPAREAARVLEKLIK